MALRADPAALTYISLCTGGGGLDLGVELAMPAARAVVLVEREAPAVATLVAAMEAGLMAPAPVWSDVRTIPARGFRGLVDGVVGGIPCQPHSVAGRRLGRDDPRDLWSAARRIVVQSGAWWVLIENVRGMLSSGGAERVWRDLGRLGFEREIGLFSAAEVGASHERERLFILGVADRWCDGRAAWSRSSAAGQRQAEFDTADGGSIGVGLADTDGFGLEGQRPDDGAGRRQDARRPAGLCVGTGLVDPARERRGEGRSGAVVRRGRDAARGADGDLGDADGEGQSQPRRHLAEGGGWARDAGFPPLRDEFGHTPPVPGSADEWRRILAARPDLAPATEPVFRRVADGVAGGLDIACARAVDSFRPDALRLLGNGVHPLVAAHALRTLAPRLAARGSAGADLIVRMMAS